MPTKRYRTMADSSAEFLREIDELLQDSGETEDGQAADKQQTTEKTNGAAVHIQSSGCQEVNESDSR